MKKMVTCLSLMALAAFGQIVGPNLVKNAGFEETDENGNAKYWGGKQPVYKVVDGGRNGGKCMSFMNDDPKNYQLCSIPVDCEPGAMYEFSCWVTMARQSASKVLVRKTSKADIWAADIHRESKGQRIGRLSSHGGKFLQVPHGRASSSMSAKA